ncbi:MAG: TIGR02147 family protein [Bdellovibrionales bacterium]|nr:TIGR02147 family protein [Bdellovibrionales bacterium]NQZ17787.1 TIGR02147 family protein [Bdellovibrionales bacterium]
MSKVLPVLLETFTCLQKDKFTDSKVNYINLVYTQDELFRDYINSHIQKAKSSNPSYSMRAFAKKVKMNPGVVSQLLSGKRKFSTKTIDKICDELFLSPTQRMEILEKSEDQKGKVKILEQSVFETMSNWSYDAFLALIQTKSFRMDLPWISKRLGVSPKNVRDMISNLLELGLIKIENERYVPATPSTQIFVGGNTTAALKKLQMDANALSRVALENEHISRRFHGTDTLAIDPRKMEEAKAYIREFRKKFCINSESNGDHARIYQLNISFYPIDQDVP